MSQYPDGLFRCDRCGEQLANDGITECAHVTQLNPDDPGDIQHFHLCNDCRTRVLTKRALAHFHDQET